MSSNAKQQDKFIAQAQRQIARLKSDRERINEQLGSLGAFVKAASGNSHRAPEKAPKGKVAAQVLGFLETHKNPITSRQMARDTGMPPGSVSGVLTKLKQSGRVANDGAGKWTLAK